MSDIYPLKLEGCVKSAIWGGQLLAQKYNKHTNDSNIGESWELTCREHERSVIKNGSFSGRTINDYIEVCGKEVIGKDFDGDRFPLLIKLLNSATPLSVQVHPNDDYAQKKHGEYGKTEMWYIMEAGEESELVIGTNGYERESFEAAAKAGKLDELLNHVKVKAGDRFFIPSGLVHAIGSDILLCEVQQNSDITYRVYDYDRVDADGKRRELHLENALDVIRDFNDNEIDELAFSSGKVTPCSPEAELIVACECFAVEKLAFAGYADMLCTNESFLSLTVTRGEGSIEYNGESYGFSTGDTYLFPQGSAHSRLAAAASSSAPR